jgi:hypothetical protein
LKVPEEPIDFEKFKSVTGGKPADGEELLPEIAEEEEAEPELNKELLNMVL